jgi:hypothetical protein
MESSEVALARSPDASAARRRWRRTGQDNLVLDKRREGGEGRLLRLELGLIIIVRLEADDVHLAVMLLLVPGPPGGQRGVKHTGAGSESYVGRAGRVQ